MVFVRGCRLAAYGPRFPIPNRGVEPTALDVMMVRAPRIAVNRPLAPTLVWRMRLAAPEGRWLRRTARSQVAAQRWPRLWVCGATGESGVSSGRESSIPMYVAARNGANHMKSILFLDDWMVEHRDSLERVWGKPRFVKEIFQEFYPGFLGYAGYISTFFDASVGRYVMYLAVLPPAADPDVFVTRLESDDPYNWDPPTYDTSVSPAWKGFQNVVVD